MLTAKKVFVAVVLFCITVIGFDFPTHAMSLAPHAYIEIQPLWAHTGLISVSININDSGRATMSGVVIANSGATQISVDARLERVNSNGTITTVASFLNLRTEGHTWVWERPHYVARGHYYRTTLTVTVSRNGETETLTKSSPVMWAS